MQTAFARGLSAILAAMTLIACSPRPTPFPAKTPAEIKQLTDVTDSVVALIRSSERDQALRQALGALSAASEQYRQHRAILSEESAGLTGCISSHSMEILELEAMVARRNEAASRQDEVAVKRRNAVARLYSMEMNECAYMSSTFLIDYEARPEALKHAAIVISEIYSAAVIFRAAFGFKVAPLLKDQIRDYETIATKLGPDEEVPVVTDALPKLKAALATLE